ncbi:MAG: DUF5692 family protein [Micrococcales bacterium]|nr:DUF5692 family protein [Micrococcales bacterium]
MFLFEAAPWYAYAMWFVVLGALIGANEIARRSRWAALALFLALPIALTIFVWPDTAGAGSSTGTWFHWVKVYSALAGCLGFLAIRFIKGAAASKWWLAFPPAILALNILEAVIRDFQVYGMHADGMVDGVHMISGPWNLMNGIAGLLNIAAISGWLGIRLSRDRYKDMIWPDMIWPWIIAYDLWNFAYVYNCVGDHSFYAGAALLISCTIPTFFITRGTWLQARAQTLAFWMMFTMTVPAFVTDSPFAVQSSHNPVALFTVSALALAANIAVMAWHVKRLRDQRINPLRGTEVYRGVEAADSVAAVAGPALGLGEVAAPDDASSLTHAPLSRH